MNRFRNLLAVAVLAGTFTCSTWHVFSRHHEAPDSGHITLRLGHWLLHTGMRESFEEAADAYHKLHPDVTVEQIPVPIRTWPAWLRTQLIGGTAPDITGLLTANEELITRYFLPLSDSIGDPNPYNAGTPLEGVPWADTFVDGLAGMRAMTPASGEISGVNLQINTLRLFYNKNLLKAVTGSDVPPADYETLRMLGSQVDRYNRAHGTRLVPISACGPYSLYLFQRLLPSQTQKLTVELSPLQNFQVQPPELARLMLDGRLSYESTPALHASLRLLRDVSSLMTPGYTSLQRNDALFTFLQGNAVMICAGSWDYAVFEQDGRFPVGIMPVVLPSTDDPVYGRFVLGLSSEADGSPEAALGIVRTSKHPELALDFLRFLTSRDVARRFSERSLRISSVVDVPPPSVALGLAPRLDGETAGFMPDFNYYGGLNANSVFQRNLYLLTGPAGGVDAFAAKLDADLPRALRQDAATQNTRQLRDIQNLDARLGLLLTQPEAERRQNPARILETRHARQVEYLFYRHLADSP